MKVMFLGFAISNHTRRWCNALVERGHDVFLVCQPDKKDDENAFDQRVKIHYLKFGGKIGYYLNAIEVRQLFKAYKPDVVNAHFATGYGTTVRVARLHPVVLSVWGSDVYKFPYKSRLNKYIVCKNLRFADAIASTSYAMADQTRKVLGDQSQKITVTPFGVNMKLFSYKEKNKNERPIIGIVKYLEPIYDIALLINAFAIVHEKSKIKPVLHIYGDGSLKEDLQEQARKLGIENDVVFFGTVPNTTIPEALSSFDVFVNCSLQESFGVAVVEAMACKVPVVVTDTPGYREIVNDGQNGIVLQDRKPETMAEAILKMLEDRLAAETLAHNGYEKVSKEYDWNNNVQTMIDLYNEIRGVN